MSRGKIQGVKNSPKMGPQLKKTRKNPHKITISHEECEKISTSDSIDFFPLKWTQIDSYLLHFGSYGHKKLFVS